MAGAGQPGARPAARHLFAAGENGAAFPHALEAAYQAGQQLDYSAARRWMAQISEVADDHLDAVSEEAVHRYQMLSFRLTFMDGDLDGARTAIQRAARAAPDARSRLETAIAMARFHTRTGNYVAAVQVTRRALREARQAEQHDLAVLCAAPRATSGGRVCPGLARRSRPARPAPPQARGPERPGGLDPVGGAARDAPGRRGRAWILRAIELSRPPTRSGPKQACAPTCRFSTGDAASCQQRWARWSKRGGSSTTSAPLTLPSPTRTSRAVRQAGQLDKARAHAHMAWDAYRRLHRQGTLVAAATASWSPVPPGTRLADDVLQAVGDGPRGRTVETEWVGYWLERARRARLDGDPDRARAHLEKADEALGSQPPAYRKREVTLERAELLLDTGKASEAHALLREV